MERAGVVNWILDPDIGPRPRVIRSGLIYLDSGQRYARVASQLKVEQDLLQTVNSEWRKVNAKFNEWFQHELVHQCQCSSCPENTGDVANWRVEGEVMPSWSDFTAIALRREDLTEPQKKHTYVMLCGYTHPSVIFSGESRSISDQGEIGYSYDLSSLSTTFSLGASCLLECVRHWAGFYLRDDTEIVNRTNEIALFLQGTSSLITDGL